MVVLVILAVAITIIGLKRRNKVSEGQSTKIAEVGDSNQKDSKASRKSTENVSLSNKSKVYSLRMPTTRSGVQGEVPLKGIKSSLSKKGSKISSKKASGKALSNKSKIDKSKSKINTSKSNAPK